MHKNSQKKAIHNTKPLSTFKHYSISNLRYNFRIQNRTLILHFCHPIQYKPHSPLRYASSSLVLERPKAYKPPLSLSLTLSLSLSLSPLDSSTEPRKASAYTRSSSLLLSCRALKRPSRLRCNHRPFRQWQLRPDNVHNGTRAILIIQLDASSRPLPPNRRQRRARRRGFGLIVVVVVCRANTRARPNT